MPETSPANTSLSSHATPLLSFSFSGLSSKITSFESSGSVTPKDMSHLGQATGAAPIFGASLLVDGAEIKCEFYGNAFPSRRTKVTISVPANLSPTGTSTSMKAICTGSQLKASRGEFIKGSATFKLTSAT
jgi:hypothetical protein